MTDAPSRALRILVVDDNRSSADALARLLRKAGDTVSAEYDGGAAIQHLRRDPPDVVLTDLKMEPVDGMQVLAAARSLRPPVDTIVFTAYGAVDVAVRAMHLGARDFLTKPVTLDQVANRLDEIRRERHPGPPAPAAPEPAEPEADTAFVARSEASRALLQTLERVAGVPSPAWIEGELGSGRSYVARSLHRLAEQAAGRSIPLTVRPPDRIGEWPTEGYVLLPQVDDLHPETQRELHRDLQQVPEGVRVLATARPEGRRRVAEGALRPELYYRLAVVVISVPPLRRRVDDILPIFDATLAAFCARYGRPVPPISPRVRDDLLRHAWPGNIRELANLAERAAVMGEEGATFEVQEESTIGVPKIDAGFNLNDYLESVERSILAEALRKANGDRAVVGKLLGVERNTLRYKLNKYGLLDRVIAALVAAAHAHPLGTGFSTETVVLHVAPGALRVDYAAEVDTALLAPRGNGRDPLDDLAVELESGLQLRVDGAPVALPAADRTLDPERSPHTVGVALAFTVPLPPGAGAVRVATGNLVDARVLRATDVRVDPRIRVRSASILPERDGRVVRDDGLRWSQEEARRAVEVSFRTEPAAWTWLARRGDDEVRAPAALEPRGLRRLAPSAAEPAAAGAWLVAALAARASADPPPRARAAAVAAGLALALALPTSGVAEGVLAAALGLAAAVGRGPVAALALAALLATAHPWPLALLGAAALLVPAPAPSVPRPRAAALAVAAWLVVRAVAARG